MSPKLSLIIPVFNEAEHLERFLVVVDSLELGLAKELVIINDGSTDASANILSNFRFSSSVVLIDQTFNQGKGAAIRAGIQKATGEFVGIQDADFETEVKDISNLLAPLLAGEADVVYGSRFQVAGHPTSGTLHFFGNKLLTTLSNALNGLSLTDMETCYKFFRAEVIKNISLESRRFGFEPEVTAKIARLSLRVVELPVSYLPRKRFEGKKLNWKDGFAALWHTVYFNVKARLNPAGCFDDSLPERYFPERRKWNWGPESGVKAGGQFDPVAGDK